MYQLLTDSACGLSAADLESHQIGVVAFQYQIAGRSQVDDPTDDQQREAFYAQIKRGVQPTTTQINVGTYMAFFQPYVQAGTPIIFMGLSSGLSGSYASACQARDILLEETPTAQIAIVDTLAASAGEGRLLLEAARLRNAGTSFAATVTWLTANRLRLQQWFTVDSLDFLYHGGRISRATATVGTLLHIKPLLDVDPTGHLRMVDKIRSRHRALSTLADRVLTALATDAQQPVLIATSGDWPAAEQVRDLIQQQYPAADLHVGPIGPEIASHTGFGCVAVFVMGPDARH